MKNYHKFNKITLEENGFLVKIQCLLIPRKSINDNFSNMELLKFLIDKNICSPNIPIHLLNNKKIKLINKKNNIIFIDNRGIDFDLITNYYFHIFEDVYNFKLNYEKLAIVLLLDLKYNPNIYKTYIYNIIRKLNYEILGFVIKQIKDLKKKVAIKTIEKNWLISRYNPKFKICHKLQFKCFKKNMNDHK